VTTVRLVGPDDWAAVREVRLEALADSPSAFASTLEREVAFDETEWRRRLADGPWWLAEEAGRPVGLVAVYPRDDGTDERHLVAMWVAPACRGTSTATDLVEAVCSWAAGTKAATVALWVVDGNERARRFYERLGFAATGQRQPVPGAPDVGEELLRRSLTA
jgi:GNAT superfamily N-acetyltransferase